MEPSAASDGFIDRFQVILVVDEVRSEDVPLSL